MPDNKEKVNILFLCTGNSCRSQMAEGWARHLKGDVVNAYSAGTLPDGVNSRTVRAMADAGVDISEQRSKHLNTYLGIDFDYVVTLCDKAREQCPVFGGETKYIHRSFEDPSLVVGSDEEILEAFRKTRDEIRAFIETLPEGLEEPVKDDRGQE